MQDGKDKRKVACLFDLDGTILDSRRCGVKAMELAMQELYGWRDSLRGVLIAGRTDSRIFADAYRTWSGGLPDEPAWSGHVERFKARYVHHLGRLLAGKPSSLHPGFPELIDRTADAAGMRPGIVTGNFKPGTWVKLAGTGITESSFGFGSFGCEAQDRPALIRLGRERGALSAGGDVVFVVIGDTPEDLRGSRETGSLCALVSTGPYGHEELEALRPDFITRDFSDPAPFLAWIASLR